MMWNRMEVMEKLSQAPETYPAPVFKAQGVKSLFYEGLPWRGAPSRVFAWFGAPDTKDEKLPAMVLVHGGGGTAFDEWVRLWNSRGYAAIAMDLCGCVPKDGYGNWQRHEYGGPPGWGGFDQIDWNTEDQWTYHAVADIILANTLIASMPEVDSDRVGVTGISWGGYLTCIISGVDHRFRFAVPVYGCGFLGENSCWLPVFASMGDQKANKWLSLWDPSVYLKNTKMPMLWVTGTNDFAYPLDSLRKSYRAALGERALSIIVRMPHGHGGPGENPEEIHAFANSILKNADPLPAILTQGTNENQAWATFESKIPAIKAELNFTRDRCNWDQREWFIQPARISENKITAIIPNDASVFYLNLIDERNLIVSTEHVELA